MKSERYMQPALRICTLFSFCSVLSEHAAGQVTERGKANITFKAFLLERKDIKVHTIYNLHMPRSAHSIILYSILCTWNRTSNREKQGKLITFEAFLLEIKDTRMHTIYNPRLARSAHSMRPKLAKTEMKDDQSQNPFLYPLLFECPIRETRQRTALNS